MGPKTNPVKGVEYPPECKEVSTELSKDELHRRLKVCIFWKLLENVTSCIKLQWLGCVKP